MKLNIKNTIILLAHITTSLLVVSYFLIMIINIATAQFTLYGLFELGVCMFVASETADELKEISIKKENRNQQQKSIF